MKGGLSDATKIAMSHAENSSQRCRWITFMNSLLFAWNESTTLADELRAPIKQVFLEFGPHRRLMFVTIWRFDETGLRVHSEMHDVAEWREVGVLSFSRVSTPPDEKATTVVVPAFNREIRAFKLVIEESGTSAESGVVLRADSDEIVVVAGADPCTLAVSGVPSAPHIFEPEYPINRYTRAPMI